jgi:uncharacterized repeat protein (TIGR01451 family)
MKITHKLKAALLIAIFAMGTAFGADPAKFAPADLSSDHSFYVFGPDGNSRAGREDSLQVVFVRIPATETTDLTLYIYDPASGSDVERSASLLSNTITTEFSIYGGGAAYSGSQTVRPTADQKGKKLDSRSYTDDLPNQWSGFGPFKARQGELEGDYRYFKVVAQGIAGRGPNFFKVGASSPNAEIFFYDATFHLIDPKGDMMNFYVEIHGGTKVVNEENYDLDNGGKPIFGGRTLNSSTTGRWAKNIIGVSDSKITQRHVYKIKKGFQGHANAGFHLTDDDGHPLKVFFGPNGPVVDAAPIDNCSTAYSFYAEITKCAPKEAVINEEFAYDLSVLAKAHVGDVTIVDFLPEGAQFVRAEPEATLQGRQLTWKYDSLADGDSVNLRVFIIPSAEGEIVNCATVTADPQICVSTYAGIPKLEITKTGPEQALITSSVPYSITVKNVGSAVARDVVVTDKVPAGMTHSSGNSELSFPVGDLQPGQSKDIAVSLVAATRGRHCNQATANASNTTAVNAEACTLVVERKLTVAKTTATPLQFVNKRASYTIVVNNPGDVALNNVLVTDSAPNGTVIVDGDGGDIVGQQVSWRIAKLNAGASKSFNVVLVGKIAGKLCNTVTVHTAEGLTGSSEACTEWKGHPAILLELIDTVDPLLPGEGTTYVIKVTNQGTADDLNVKIVAAFPSQISPVSASGSTEATVDGKTVTVAPYGVLKPGQVIEWRIKAKAETAGDSRLIIKMFSDFLKTPVTEEESTHVY